MLEITFGRSRAAQPQISPAILSAILETRAAISHRSGLLWAEHCTDCAMPACYSMCSLYSPRPDLKCRRLEQGVQEVAIEGLSGSPAVMQVAFRQWGKLESSGSVLVVPEPAVKRIEIVGDFVDRVVNSGMLPFDFARRFAWAVNRRLPLRRRERWDLAAEAFLFEAINPSPQVRRLLVSLKPDDNERILQKTILLKPGYSRLILRLDEWLGTRTSLDRVIVQIEPQEDSPSPLVISYADFVRFRTKLTDLEFAEPLHASAPQPGVKCVLWDLDNTLWDGVLIEDGVDGVRLNPRAAAAIIELDERGILNSVLSKNSEADAVAALRKFGLYEYFVAPSISWNPKSLAITPLAKKLNINADTFLFVDDQPFERAEVSAAHPEVEVFDVSQLKNLLQHPRVQGEKSREARQRRIMYQQEALREQALGESGVEDIATFLKSCNLKLEIEILSDININRVFELTERTNQLNYSGERLGWPALERVMNDPGKLGLVLRASDKFGDYGIIGFALVDTGNWIVECFFMSCRVQRKKVDHAFFNRLAQIAVQRGAEQLKIVFKPTPKNVPSREVLEKEMSLSFERGDGCDLFVVKAGDSIALADVVRVEDDLG